MHRSGKRAVMVILILTGVLIINNSVGWAITSDEIFSVLQFNMTTPGARAAGAGASFIGLADDATAVVSNPAGLVLLSNPELSAEIKYINYHNKFFSKADGTKVRYEEFDDSVFSPSFLGFVYPGKELSLKGFSLGVYRHELTNYKASFESEQSNNLGIINPVKANVDMLIVDYGFSGAYRINQSLSVGLSLKLSSLDLSMKTVRFNDAAKTSIRTSTSIDDTDMAFGWNIGILWSLTDKLSVGAVYKPGPKFGLKSEYDKNYTKPRSWENDFTLKVPDLYGVGVKYSLLEQVTVTADINFITYSDLTDDFKDIYGGDPGDYTVDDAVEFHIGGEYVLLTETPVAFRLGLYTDPDHQIKYNGQGVDQVYFPGGDDTVHYTFGIGIILGSDAQIDAVYNYADTCEQFSISGAYRF